MFFLKMKNRFILKMLLILSVAVCLLILFSNFSVAVESPELEWTGDDCSCVPEMPWVSYALYKNEEEPEPVKINFSTFERIGYYKLLPNKYGDFEDNDLKHWKEKKFKKEAMKYGTSIDVVIDIQEVDLANDFVLYIQLVRNIADLIEKYSCNGLVIDFTGIKITAGYKKLPHFMKLLNDRIIYKNVEVMVSVIYPYNYIQYQKELKDKNELKKLVKRNKYLDKYVDYYLIKKSDGSQLNILEIKDIQTVVLNLEKRKKIIPFINFDNDNFESTYNLVSETNAGFGGVGLWHLMTGTQKNLQYLQGKYVQSEDSIDFVKWIMREYFPSACKHVCPNRIIYRTIFLSVAGIFLCLFILSRLRCDVKAFLKRFFWFYFAIGILLLLYFEILSLCDPVMLGKRNEVTLGLLLLVFIYGGVKLYQKKKEANFP